MLQAVAALVLVVASVIILRTAWLLERDVPVAERPAAAEDRQGWQEAA